MMDRYGVFFIFGFLLGTSFLPTHPTYAENEAEAFRRFKQSRINPETGLPMTLDPGNFTGEVKRGYKIAKEHPGLLSQLPCPCACEGIGHENLLDCFVTDHAST